MMRRVVRLAGWALTAAVAGCAPSPRAYVAEPLSGSWVVAVLPLSNFTPSRDAPDRIGPMLQVELIHRSGLSVIESGRVEEALATEPWILTDRIPPDLVDSLGAALGADALLVGSVLAYGYRNDEGAEIPEVSLSLRLLEVPGARVLWSAVHNRDGADRESVFGLGRVEGLERLAGEAIQEVLETFPPVGGSSPRKVPGPEGGQP